MERWLKDHGTSYFSGDYARIRGWRETHPGYQRQWRARRRREIHNVMGVSFYSDEKTACRLKVSVFEIKAARQGLVEKGLIAYRNGLTQVLSLPKGSL